MDLHEKKRHVEIEYSYCQKLTSFECEPSCCSFLTGWPVHVRGHRSLYYGLHADEPHVADLRRLVHAGVRRSARRVATRRRRANRVRSQAHWVSRGVYLVLVGDYSRES